MVETPEVDTESGTSVLFGDEYYGPQASAGFNDVGFQHFIELLQIYIY